MVYSGIKGKCLQFYALLIVSASGFGSVSELASEVDAHVFFIRQAKENAPIVDVVSNTRVKVLLPSKENKVMRYSRVGWIEKKLRPAGRITICETSGRSEYETFTSQDFISTHGTSYFKFKYIADRDIADTYVALIYTYPENPIDKGIAFAKTGNLQGGELESKEVYFPNVVLPDGTNYNFEFYSAGFPLEMFMLPQVALHPKSQSLLIPWNLRLEKYLEFAERKSLTRPPNPFEISFFSLDSKAVRERGIQSLKVGLRIMPDGTVELLNGDPNLIQDESDKLKNDTTLWRFFPAVKNGHPYEMKVSAPLRLK